MMALSPQWDGGSVVCITHLHSCKYSLYAQFTCITTRHSAHTHICTRKCRTGAHKRTHRSRIIAYPTCKHVAVVCSCVVVVVVVEVGSAASPVFRHRPTEQSHTRTVWRARMSRVIMPIGPMYHFNYCAELISTIYIRANELRVFVACFSCVRLLGMNHVDGIQCIL